MCGIEQDSSRDIIETANDGLWILDARLVTVFVNRRIADMLGYTVEEMSERPLSDFIAADAWDETEAGLRRPGPTARDHAHYRKKDGSALYATISDATRTGADWTQARGSVVLLSNAVEQTADSVLISDSLGRIEYVNPAFEETTGYTRAEVLGKTPRVLKSGNLGCPGQTPTFNEPSDVRACQRGCDATGWSLRVTGGLEDDRDRA